MYEPKTYLCVDQTLKPMCLFLELIVQLPKKSMTDDTNLSSLETNKILLTVGAPRNRLPLSQIDDCGFK